MACGAIASLALSVAGAAMQSGANQLTQNNMNDLTEQELQRQQAFARKGQQVFQNSLGQSTPSSAQQQLNQGQQQALGNIQQVQGVPLSLSMPSSTGINTAANTARQNMSNQAAAGYQGRSNFPLQQYLKDLSANSQLGLIGNQAQQSESVLPYELSQAQNSYGWLSGLGGLLGTAGSLVGMSGLASAGAGAGAASSSGDYLDLMGQPSFPAAYGYLNPGLTQGLLSPGNMYNLPIY